MSEPLWYREGMLAAPATDANLSFMQVPTVLPLRPDLWRIYYATRDSGNTSAIAALDIDPANMRILARHDPPLLETAEPGAFDRFGMGPCCALAGAGGAVALYYGGVQQLRDVPYEVAIGLAMADDGLRFARACAGPVLAKGPFDPYYSSAPFVRVREGTYEMWYVSGTPWQAVPGGFDPVYDVRRTRSRDGVVWDARTSLALRASDLGGVAIGRPWVAHDGTSERLWFALRGADFRDGGSEPYRLWSVALDESGEAVLATAAPVRFANPASEDEWDARMETSACVVAHGAELLMFYNGNEFGKHGIAWARTRRGESA